MKRIKIYLLFIDLLKRTLVMSTIILILALNVLDYFPPLCQALFGRNNILRVLTRLNDLYDFLHCDRTQGDLSVNTIFCSRSTNNAD